MSVIIKKRNVAIALLLTIAIEEKEKNKRAIWTSRYLLRRKRRDMHHNLFTELVFEDPDRFRRCLRMNTALFEFLLAK